VNAVTGNAPDGAVSALSQDRMTLVITSREPGGVRTVTLNRQPDAGPFTDADVAAARALTPRPSMQPGQRNRSRRIRTRFGILWTHVATGPPTWWLPRLRREKDGTLMAGWLRFAVALKLSRSQEES
jgi:hypothetical protein